MPCKSFAYNLDHSTVSLLPSGDAKTKIIPKAMAQVRFKSVYFEFDGEQHKPYLVFDGDIEAYSTMKGSDDDFYSSVTRVVFSPENRPSGTWRYDFDDKQVADIASAGWFTYGNDTPSELLSNSLALIVDNVQVDILNPDKEKDEAPILKVGPADNHMYTFNINDYELAPFIIDNIRVPQVEFETIFDVEREQQNTAAQHAATVRKESVIKEAKPLTEQQIRIRNAAMNAILYEQSVWDEIDEYRVAHSSQYRKEMQAMKTKQNMSSSNTATLKTANESSKNNQTDVDGNTKLNDFLGQFKSASSVSSVPTPDATDNVVIKSTSETTMKDVWAQFKQTAAAGDGIQSAENHGKLNSSDAKNAEDKDGNGVDDRVEAGVNAASAIIDAAKTSNASFVAETADVKNTEDKDGDGIDDRLEAGVAAIESGKADEMAKAKIAVAEAKFDRYGNTDNKDKLTQSVAKSETKKSYSEMGS